MWLEEIKNVTYIVNDDIVVRSRETRNAKRSTEQNSLLSDFILVSVSHFTQKDRLLRILL